MLIETKRLLLRPWEERDLDPFASMNRDPEVMEYFPDLLTRDESRQRIERQNQRLREDGFAFLAVEELATSTFVGWIGLGRVPFDASFAPAVEIGWRLARDFWGQGYASEGARACLRYGFEVLDLPEIVAFTFEGNARSRALMARIGMRQDIEASFMHPNLASDHWLAPHVLYRARPS